MFGKKVGEKITALYFMGIAVLMYYFLEQQFTLGIPIPHRQGFTMLLIFSGFVVFLAEPDISRASVVMKSSLVLSVPLLVMVTASLYVWCAELTDFSVIKRGLSYYSVYMNQVFAALAAGVFLYIFGEKGIWYNLTALITANLLMILQVMQEHGIGVYFQELWILIKTFAANTGDVIHEAEIHELVFCMGIYLLYMLFLRKRRFGFIAMFFLGFFCFISAFKRIAIIGIVLALLVGSLLILWDRKGGKKYISGIITGLLSVILVLLFLYIFATEQGVFEMMESRGIDTTGRAQVYKYVNRFYTFSPAYMGHGMGFLTYQLTDMLELGVNSVHNDFLQFYIDLGFWGYLLWLLSMTILRTKYFGRGGKTRNEIITFAVLLYMIIVSSTDNTLNYQLFHTSIAMIIMGHGFDERVLEEERRYENFNGK